MSNLRAARPRAARSRKAPMTRLLFLLTLVIAPGCAPAGETQTDAAAPEARTTMSQEVSMLRRFPEEVQGALRVNSGMETTTREAIRDRGEWDRLWSRLNARGGRPITRPEVDFAREMVLVAAMGRRRTGGYIVRIESARTEGGEVVATVVETSPGPRCGAITMATAPADAVVVTRSTLPVRWDVRQVVTDCP
jgi:hypothetical protein